MLTGSVAVRREIEASWRRSRRAGLSPLSQAGTTPVRPVPSSHPLRRLAADVPGRFEEDISGSPFTAVLADAGGVIVDLRPGTPELDDNGRAFTARCAGRGELSPLRNLPALVNDRLAVLGATGEITVHDLPERLRNDFAKQPRSLMAKTEYELIVKTLRTCGGNRVKAAEHLASAARRRTAGCAPSASRPDPAVHEVEKT
ncbi:hypothetical protein ADL03_30595 [Nocardia sp. NRRL S-836]|nr:hypothetical protein ADL03_30595 [Nocardia sp. NRRL S-836]